MGDLFRRLKVGGINVDISTFSQASKNREVKLFTNIYKQLNKKIQKQFNRDKFNICPIDSTAISLTSKLLHNLGFHNLDRFKCNGLLNENLINFGNEHDYKFGDKMINHLSDICFPKKR